MQLSLTARAIFSGVRGGGRREGRGCSPEGSGGRGASCISRELGCNNYYLSPTLSLVPIILVRTTPHPSAGTLPPSLPLPRAVLRKSNWFPEFIARQIFPLSSRLHARPNTRAMVYRCRPGVIRARVTHTRDWSAANKFSTNNKSARGGATECASPPEGWK